MDEPLVFFIRVNVVVSVNKMFVKNKILSKEARTMKEDIHSWMCSVKVSNTFSLNYTNISVRYIFYLKHSFNRRDVDNLIKMVQDSIFGYFGIPDNKIIDLNAHKRSIKGSKYEWVEVKISSSISKDNVEVDYNSLINSMPEELRHYMT